MTYQKTVLEPLTTRQQVAAFLVYLMDTVPPGDIRRAIGDAREYSLGSYRAEDTGITVARLPLGPLESVALDFADELLETVEPRVAVLLGQEKADGNQD